MHEANKELEEKREEKQETLKEREKRFKKLDVQHEALFREMTEFRTKIYRKWEKSEKEEKAVWVILEERL